MHSTVQLSSYMIPTSRTKPHPSQTPFDSNASLMVKSLGPVTHGSLRYDRMRSQPLSSLSLLHTVNHTSVLHDRGDSYSGTAADVRGHSSKAGSDRREQVSLSTATVSKRGLIALKPQTSGGDSKKEAFEPMWRSKTSYGMTPNIGKRKLGWARTMARKEGESDLGGVTVGDLRGAIDTNYPATAGAEFSRASAYIKQNINRLARHYEQVTAAHRDPTAADRTAAAAVVPEEGVSAAHARADSSRSSERLRKLPAAGVDADDGDRSTGAADSGVPLAATGAVKQNGARGEDGYLPEAPHDGRGGSAEEVGVAVEDEDSMPERGAYSSSSEGGAAAEDLIAV